MPRPKRTKVAPVKEAPTPAPTTVPNPSSPATHDIQEVATNPDRALVLQEQAHLRDSGSDVSLVSQGLKIASRRVVARKSQSGRELQPRETRMSGALRTEGDVAPTAAGRMGTGRAKEHATPAPKMHTRNGRTRQRKIIKKVVEDDKVLEELKKRRDAALQAEKASAIVVPNTQSSGVGTDQEAKATEEQESTLTLNDTSEDISHGAVIVPSTPAVEASVVAIANFKRRPRQPSILRMVQQQQQQQQQQERQNRDETQTNGTDAAGDSSLLGLSDPEDESTPMPNRATVRQSAERTRQSSSSRKRKASEAVDSSQAHTLQSSPPLKHTSPLTAIQRSSVLHSDSPSLPDQSTIVNQARNQNSKNAPDSPINESQAPPQSSSGEESDSETPELDTRQRKQRKTQAQPNGNKKAPVSKKSVLTTAHLRNMLPKCQRRSAADRSSPFEIHSSSSATINLHNNNNNNSDYDELTLAKSQRFHKQQKNDHAKDLSSNKQPRKTYSQQHHLFSDKENESVSEEDQSGDDHDDDNNDSDASSDSDNDKTDGNFGGSRSRRKASKGKKISARGSKKANNNNNKKALQEINQQRQHKPSAELQSIANKFREIDAWKMSFESIDVDAGGETGVGSSPWR